MGAHIGQPAYRSPWRCYSEMIKDADGLMGAPRVGKRQGAGMSDVTGGSRAYVAAGTCKTCFNSVHTHTHMP